MLKIKKSVYVFLFVFSLFSLGAPRAFGASGSDGGGSGNSGAGWAISVGLLVLATQVIPAVLTSLQADNDDLKTCIPNDYGPDERDRLKKAEYLFIASPPAILLATGLGFLGAFHRPTTDSPVSSNWKSGTLFALSTVALAASAGAELAGSVITANVFEKLKDPMESNCGGVDNSHRAQLSAALTFGFIGGGLQGVTTLVMAGIGGWNLYKRLTNPETETARDAV